VLILEKVIVFQGTYLGKHPGPIGQKMMRGFLKVLGNQSWKPKSIFFLGEAVRLLTDEFDLLELLRTLDEQGIDLLACRAAVEDLGLDTKLKVGRISSTGVLVDLISRYEVITM